ncbi:hypothetical protein QK290_05845 [Pseudarthrobacter sp. AL07]|uniref:hypothetical protein n=1 Tax=Pseudarthrobacter sp. AL07 TaxID=3042233 RepID=UPI002499C9B1|nr:hypothetical protein [Pseudarthrobacter sp. AL07]MDI3208049.1 hypothetical protein [Pseudarthrobacter sp. AL07]
MAKRREITKKYATDYAKSSKSVKGLILDELVGVTGWSRANARRALSTARKRKGPAKSVVRKPRGRTLRPCAGPAEPLHRQHESNRLALQQTREEDPHLRQTADPYQPVIDSGILTEAKATEVAALMEITNPADLTRGITTIQTKLIALAAAKTRALEHSPTRAQIAEASTTLSRAS